MVNIPKTYKYRYNGVIHTGPSVPAGAELLETTDTLDTQTYNILSLIYPVGSIYIGVQEDCPLKTLISGSTWVKISEGRVLQGSDSGHSAGTTIAAGLPNISISIPTTGSGDNNNQWHRANLLNNGGSLARGGLDNDNWVVQTIETNLSSIYGNSSTVQPPAYVVNIWRRTA